MSSNLENNDDTVIIVNKALKFVPTDTLYTVTASLKHLFLSNNKFESLPKEIEDIVTLETIHLNQNVFTEVPRLPSNLKVLVMSSNPLKELDSLKNLSILTALEKLTLDVCELSCVDDVLACVNLHTLELHENSIEQLSQDINQLSKLKHLSLHCNCLEELPLSIVDLTNLEWFSLHCNYLQELPTNFGNLTALQRLSLHCNQLTTLPLSFSNCTNIIALSLFSNKLESIDGSIFTNLTKCKVLALHKNKLPSSSLPPKEDVPHLSEYYVNERVKSLNKFVSSDEITNDFQKFSKTKVFVYNVDRLCQATWGVMFPHAIKRFNISEGTEVNMNFLKQQTYINVIKFEEMQTKHLLNDYEYKYSCWYWKDKKCPKEVYLLKVGVEQDLRRVATKLKHTEVWLMGLFLGDNCVKLCPLKRDSDFSYDVFEALRV